MNSSDMFKCNFFKIPFKVLTTFLFFFFIAECFCQVQLHKLFYTKPASQFEEALLMGNGRIGATIYGGVKEERISLNEATLWSGGPFDPSMNPKAKDYLQPVREALFDENYKKADSLMKFMQGKYSESYAPLGNLFINFNHALSDASDYKRELDISNAYTKISYEIDGTNFTREYFVSYPDQVLVIRLISQGKNKLNISCHFNSLLTHSQKRKDDDLMMHGFSPVHAEPNYRGNIPNAIINDTVRAMRFVAQLRVLKNNGNIKIQNSEIQISDANEIVLLVSLATSYNGPEKNPGLSGKDEVKIAESQIKKAVKKSFSILKQRHTDDYRKYFDRVYLDLGHTDQETKTTMDRLNNFALGKIDNSLMALFFQYSRYLLISASRPGGMPANLQGIWNEVMRPPWSSNYTTNINAEMNYWGAEISNLSQLHKPLLDFIGRLQRTGTITARDYFDCDGWTCNHNTDIWAMTNPVGGFGEGDASWASWPLGGAWLSTHLWEHYLFNGDKKYLKSYAYPIMKGAVKFCLDFLTTDKKGYLVTAPATSPENYFKIPETGYQGPSAYGTTSDLAMIRQLFNDFLQASRVLNKEDDLFNKVNVALKKMYPYQIGKKGQLQEWYHDWDDVDPHHRHLSHLFAAYPGNTITTDKTPKLADAVRKSLEIRTNEGTGWAITWRINLWARLKNGEMAYDAIKKMMRVISNDAVIKMNGGGIYPNLLGAHPPFQIDGNFGGGAGIAEMLLQSHDGYIDLLPALPQEWNTGEVRGLCARGGYEVTMKWDDGMLTNAEIYAKLGGQVKVRYKNKELVLSTTKGKKYEINTQHFKSIQ